MPEPSPLIGNISDTARWVAFYRAMESERPDAVFHDPYARRLAGELGAEIVRTMPGAKQHAWAMIVRTFLFDELITRLVEKEKVDTVLNLAAGLDARAYRLPLPPELRWIDVDLPGILDYKEALLAGETPRCRHETVRLDLADRAERQALFARVGASARKALVATEGLLVYLTREQVTDLALDLHAQPSFRYWLIDYVSPMLLARLQRTYMKSFDQSRFRFHFAPEEGTDFYRPLGWREVEFRSSIEEGRRLGRQMRGAWLWRSIGRFMPAEKRALYQRMSGVVLLERI